MLHGAPVLGGVSSVGCKSQSVPIGGLVVGKASGFNDMLTFSSTPFVNPTNVITSFYESSLLGSSRRVTLNSRLLEHSLELKRNTWCVGLVCGKKDVLMSSKI